MRAADHFYALATARGHALRRPEALPWLTTQGHAAVEGEVRSDVYDALCAIFHLLDGDEDALRAKRRRPVLPDFLFGDVGVEFDEDQHFTIQRLATFAVYPASAVLRFDRAEYAKLCLKIAPRAARAFAHKAAAEFPGPAGRARQRAYFDAFRDLAGPAFGNGPVLRLPAPDRDADAALAAFERAVSV